MKQTESTRCENGTKADGSTGATRAFPMLLIAGAWLVGTVVFESASVGNDSSGPDADSIASIVEQWKSRETNFAILQSDITGFDRIDDRQSLRSTTATIVKAKPRTTKTLSRPSVATGESGSGRAAAAAVRLSSHQAEIVRGAIRVHPVKQSRNPVENETHLENDTGHGSTSDDRSDD